MVLKKLIQKSFRLFGREIKQSHTFILDKRQMKTFSNMKYQFDRVSLASISGNIVECGIGRGRTFLYLSHLAEEEGLNREVWGFDSFEGFPEPSVEDTSPRNPKKGEWNYMSVNDMWKILKNAGISSEWSKKNVKIIPGFFEDSLKAYSEAPIALLHLDVDLYDSYMTTLNEFYKYVVKDGIILFDEYSDEYNDLNWPGAKKAIDEFFSDKPETPQKNEESGKYFVVKQ